MAFDQTTRNRLNRFVADSRGILAAEFTRQLQATYGMNPATGEIADINSLAGLTPHQQETAQLLRDTFEHYLAANDHTKGKSKEKESRLAALDRIVREQAFTVLNRLAALRMSEARGFLTESLANGYESKGFQLFHRIAGTSLGETGEAYTHYLFSIFDEFTLDLSVLFDRFAAQGRLFPSTPVLLELLALINDDEVAPLWAEDETIGWIYQYFNSQEERKKMRDASQAPRNSRELAVRNQFFTPRYVVEFLTDNTLGRIWYEMTKGQTKLIDECEYIVKRPNEIFLIEGEQAPELDSTEGLSQDELLQQTVYIEHRALKDPRDIKMLDPACGSMHFGLYCFDLFERIYEEAWDIELAQGTECFIRENNQASLTQSYSDKAEFLTHVPRLIIENNIHGVDIDPRAAQVAGMSLWQRAHNSWQKASVKPQLRPQITKSNIVCAEPMPGEKELLQEFSSQLKPTVLGQLVEVIFEKMQLAGEAGTLLKIEKEIEDAIAGAKAVWQQQNQALSQFPDLAKVAKQQSEGKGEVDFDVSDIDDEGFWQQAEQKILDALAAYASSTSADMNEQKRLFASDAAKGFAFIDLCKKRFDVTLMNPPFGEVAKNSSSYIKKNYPKLGINIFSAFLERGFEFSENGYLGAITDSTWIKKTDYKDLRAVFTSKIGAINILLDKGWGVLDDANVSTSSFICSPNKEKSKAFFINLKKYELQEKREHLKTYIEDIRNNISNSDVVTRSYKYFQNFDKLVFAYEAPNEYVSAFENWDKLSPKFGVARRGYTPGDTFRFFRCFWEVPVDKYLKEWKLLNNGGSFKPLLGDGLMMAKYSPEWGEYKPLAGFRLESEKWIGKPGIGWGKRTDYMYAYPFPAGSMFSNEGHCIFPEIDKWGLLGYLNSSLGQALVNLITGQHKLAGYVSNIPFLPDNDAINKLGVIAKDIFETAQKEGYFEENTYLFDPNIFKKYSFEQLRDVSIASNYSYQESLKNLNEISLESMNSDGEYEKENGLIKLELIKPYAKSDEVALSNQFISFIIGELIGRWQSYEPAKDPYAEYEQTNYDSFFVANYDVFLITKSAVNSIEVGLSEYIQKQYPDWYFKTTGVLGDDIEHYINNSGKFFDFHLRQYSKSRRQAPVYWPLQSISKNTTVWLYFHNLTNQSLLSIINELVEPSLEELKADESSLKLNSNRSSKEELNLNELTDKIFELEHFKSELVNVSKFWLPNLDDGVLITAAPLWRLFQHKAWQKKLKQTWEKLEDGEYDWAHLAFSTWPERVLKKCHADRSLAIAHEVEDDLWHEVEVIKGRKKEPVWEWQPKPLSDAELNAYIREKIATDERLKLYRSNQSANANGGAL